MDAALPGLYAWGSTVALRGLLIRDEWLAQSFALLSGVSLVAALSFEARPGRLADRLVAFGFVGGAVASWLCLGYAGLDAQIDPLTGLTGMLGWAAFAFGWGRLRNSSRVLYNTELSKVLSAGYPPRGQVHPLGRWTQGFALLCAWLIQVAAWTATSRERSVLVHALALAGSLGVLSVGSVLASELAVSPRGGGLRAPAWGPWLLVGGVVTAACGLQWAQ